MEQAVTGVTLILSRYWDCILVRRSCWAGYQRAEEASQLKFHYGNRMGPAVERACVATCDDKQDADLSGELTTFVNRRVFFWVMTSLTM